MSYLPILFALALVAGCSLPVGQGTATSHTTPTPNLPTALHVMSHSNYYQFDKMVTDTASVRQLYAAIYALPKLGFPAVCPVAYGHKYTLVFLQGTHIFAQVIYDAQDCQPVYITRSDIRWGGQVGFRPLFARTLGISLPLAPPN